MPVSEHPISLGRLKKRAEFLRARGGRSWRASSLVLQAKKQSQADGAGGVARFGFTATKRLGNAVTRNRARRRLKETVRIAAGKLARPGYDYVVIARDGALTHSFSEIEKDLHAAFDRVHKGSSERA